MALRKLLLALFCLAVSVGVVAQNGIGEKQPAPTAAASTESKPDDKSWVKSVNTEKFAESKPKAASKDTLSDLQVISKNIQALKGDVITLNKDLREMEEKLLFPSNTRYSVFVSLTTGQFFQLESVKLKLDGKLVATQLFSEKQRAALARGGIHRLYITNLNEGLHSATAFFTGVGPEGRPYKRASTIEFEKGIGSEYLELAIVDDAATQEAVFQMKRW